MSQSCGENYPDAIARRDVPVLSGAERERGALLYISIDIIIFVNGLGRLSLLHDTSRARCLARNGDDGSQVLLPPCSGPLSLLRSAPVSSSVIRGLGHAVGSRGI